MPHFSPAVVILAAGASVRMGRPKMLLPWAATSVLGHLLRIWRDAGAAQVAVVCASSPGAVWAELDRLGCPEPCRIVNPAPERGMFSSIQAAARWKGWKPDLTHWLIGLGDQPHVRPESLRSLLQFAAEHPHRISQPSL